MEKESDSCDYGVFMIGVIQFILGALLVGYVWSIVWGVMIYKKSKPVIRVVSTGENANCNSLLIIRKPLNTLVYTDSPNINKP